MTEARPAQWYVYDGHEPAGPYAAEEILTYPGVQHDTQVCRVGEEQWQPLRDVPELCRPATPPAAAPALAPAIALPPADVSPDQPWALAGLVARVLAAPRPLLFLMLLLTSLGVGFGVHVAFRAHIDPRLDDAQALLMNNQAGAAEAVCRTVLAERPDSARGSFLLAESLFLQGRKAEALAAYKQAQKINPRDQRIEQKIIILQGMGGGQ